MDLLDVDTSHTGWWLLLLGLWHFGALPWCWHVMVGDLMVIIHTGWFLNLGCVTFNGGLPRCWQVIQCDFHIVGFVTVHSLSMLPIHTVARTSEDTQIGSIEVELYVAGVVCELPQHCVTWSMTEVYNGWHVCCDYLCSDPYLFTYTCLLVRSLYGVWVTLSWYQ